MQRPAHPPWMKHGSNRQTMLGCFREIMMRASFSTAPRSASVMPCSQCAKKTGTEQQPMVSVDRSARAPKAVRQRNPASREGTARPRPLFRKTPQSRTHLHANLLDGADAVVLVASLDAQAAPVRAPTDHLDDLVAIHGGRWRRTAPQRPRVPPGLLKTAAHSELASTEAEADPSSGWWPAEPLGTPAPTNG